jgi:hypothetical protein
MANRLLSLSQSGLQIAIVSVYVHMGVRLGVGMWGTNVTCNCSHVPDYG